jgi:conjugative relaxase-like TrwC/TraI family protein
MSLKLTPRKNASKAKAYHAKDEPTLERESGGKLLAQLGLDADTLSEHAFNRLIDNKTEAGKSITRNNAAGRICMTDITVGLPKSVTLALVFGPNPEDIMRVIWNTIHRLMDEKVEPQAAARVRVGGRDEDRVTGNLAYQADFHLTARPVDGRVLPHGHAHIKVPNLTYDIAEGKFKALKTQEIHQRAPDLQAAFLKELRRGMGQIGYRTVRKGKSFELDGVTRATINKFSERRNAIKDWLKAHGGKGKNMAATITREEKPLVVDMTSLRADWRSILTVREANVFKRIQARPKIGRNPNFAQQRVDMLRFIRHSEPAMPAKGIEHGLFSR